MSQQESRGLLVLGHRNPDTDASTAAFALAALINESDLFEEPARPAILGPLPPQAKFVFAKAKLEAPPIVDHVRPRVLHMATRELTTLSPEDTLRDALGLLISSEKSMLPVVSEDGRVEAVFSHRRDIFKFLLGFSVAPLLGQLLNWEQLCELPGATRTDQGEVKNSIDGELRVAIDGGEDWKQLCTQDDVLVCGGIDSWRSLEATQRPSRVILIGSEPQSGEQPESLLCYPGDLSGFFQNLQTQIPLSSLDLGTGPCVGAADEIKDIESLVQESRHALPVLDEQRRLVGVIAKSDFKKNVSQKIVLVDHFETSQAVAGIEHAEVVGFVDHHRVGDLQTQKPVFVDCRPVGSSCSIIASRYRESQLAPSKAVSTLLLGGLVSDTLGLRSPTTTALDRDISEFLSVIIGEDFQEFALEVLKAGDDLLTADPQDIWHRDQKQFSILNRTISVAQLETVSLASLPSETFQSYRKLLQAHHQESGELCSVLFVTDVLTQESWATYFEDEDARGVFQEAFGDEAACPDFLKLKGIVSRKKQVLPRLLEGLASR